MSFFNKIWKNIRDKKDSHSMNMQTGSNPTNSEVPSSHPALGQKGKTFYKRIDQLIHQQSEVDRKKKDDDGGKTSSESGIEDVENIEPNEVIGNDGMTSDDEVILPPGIVTEMAKSKNQVSRHVSVSRSGRYKQKHRKRSNLFDVVNAEDPCKKELSTSSDVVACSDVDWSSSKKSSSGVLVTSLSLSSAFDSNDFKSIEQDVSQTVIEVEVMTTSQSLLSPPTTGVGHPDVIRSKEGVTVNPSFITFAKSDVKAQIPHFSYNNNSNHNFVHETIKL